MKNYFEYPWALFGLAIPFIVGVALFRVQKNLLNGLAMWIPPTFKKDLPLFAFLRNNFFLFVGMVLLVLAAMGPLFGTLLVSSFESRHGLMIVALKADEKSSQGFIDLQSRLLSQIRTEYMVREGSRIGIIPYGGESEIYCPITLDSGFYDHVLFSLKNVSEKSMDTEVSNKADSLGDSIKIAIESLQNQSFNTRQIVVVASENKGMEEQLFEALIRADIPKDIGLTLIFPTAFKVSEIVDDFCKRRNARCVALNSKLIPEGRILEIIKIGDSKNVFFEGEAFSYVATPSWCLLPAMLCLTIALLFPPNLSGPVVAKLGGIAEK